MIDANYMEKVEVRVSENIDTVSIFSKSEINVFETRIQNFYYSQFYPKCTASENWNYLIAEAQGEYIWLVHHDERPLNMKRFLTEVMSIIDKSEYDLIISDLMLEKKVRIFGRICMIRSNHQLWKPLKKYLLVNFPSSILWCNFLGPASVLIVKSSLGYQFRNDLEWLVDVDAYLDLVKYRKDCSIRLLNGNDKMVISEQGCHIPTLTKSLGRNTHKLANKERALILHQYKENVLLPRLFALIAYVSLHLCRIATIKVSRR
jgi:hypothetical protein